MIHAVGRGGEGEEREREGQVIFHRYFREAG